MCPYMTILFYLLLVRCGIKYGFLCLHTTINIITPFCNSRTAFLDFFGAEIKFREVGYIKGKTILFS